MKLEARRHIGTETRRETPKLQNAETRKLAPAMIVFGVSAFGQSGGGYVIKKSTIDSGGGTVTGGDYRLAGTIGQSDAGTLTGSGGYELQGSFWPGAQGCGFCRLYGDLYPQPSHDA